MLGCGHISWPGTPFLRGLQTSIPGTGKTLTGYVLEVAQVLIDHCGPWLPSSRPPWGPDLRRYFLCVR